jgi:hypothetical protein
MLTDFHKTRFVWRRVTYTLTNIDNDTNGPNGLPSITTTLTIHVVGKKTATIIRDSNALGFRLLHVGASGRLTLQNVTLANGLAQNVTPPNFLASQGGGLFNNGGIVTVENSAFVNNSAGPGGGLVNNNGAVTIIGSIFDGHIASDTGALKNSGELTIITSTFSNNTSAFDAGGLTTTNGIVRITQSRFTKNDSHPNQQAGALHVMGGVVLITETTFDGNRADGPGAILVARFFGDQSVDATLIVRDSAFVENVAFTSGAGAAIFNVGIVQVTNTTFARNSLQDELDPAADGIVIANFGTLSLTNSTLAENTAVQSPFRPIRFRAVISGATNARTFLQNTIVTHNAEDTFVQDCEGPITSLGNNLISDTAGCAIVLQPTDLTGDAGLCPFTDNGTPGNGHFPLLATSRAINAANDAVCPKKDQIGQPRKPHCDIGAIEFTHKHTELVQNLP